MQEPELRSKHETLCDDLTPFAIALVAEVSLKLPHVHKHAWRLYDSSLFTTPPT